MRTLDEIKVAVRTQNGANLAPGYTHVPVVADSGVAVRSVKNQDWLTLSIVEMTDPEETRAETRLGRDEVFDIAAALIYHAQFLVAE